MVKNRKRKAVTRSLMAHTEMSYGVAHKVLNDERIQQLADEAEAGYDPDKLVPRKITPP